jgi:hypothetical protein
MGRFGLLVGLSVVHKTHLNCRVVNVLGVVLSGAASGRCVVYMKRPYIKIMPSLRLPTQIPTSPEVDR